MFVLFLKSHTMVLIKNQKGSPNIRSVRKAFNDNIGKYIENNNLEILVKNNEGEIYPDAVVNVTGISLTEDIEKELDKFETFKEVKLNFFDLNADIHVDEKVKYINDYLFSDLNCDNGVVHAKRPKNKETILKTIKAVNGKAYYSIEGKSKANEELTLTDTKITKNKTYATKHEDLKEDKQSVIKNISNDEFFSVNITDDAKKVYEVNLGKITKYVKKE